MDSSAKNNNTCNIILLLTRLVCFLYAYCVHLKELKTKLNNSIYLANMEKEVVPLN